MKEDRIKANICDRRRNFSSIGFAVGRIKISVTFANTTSPNDNPHVIRNNSLTVRCHLAAIFIATVVVIASELTSLVQRYVKHTKKVSIESVDNHADFPLVTVCEMQQLDNRAILSGRYLIVSEEYKRLKKISLECVTYMKIKKNCLMLSTMPSLLILSANFAKDTITGSGIQKSKFIVSCTNGYDKCNEVDQIFDPYFFNCLI